MRYAAIPVSILLFTILVGIPLDVRPTTGVVAPSLAPSSFQVAINPASVICPECSPPQNIWTPYGPDPSINTLVMKFYSYDQAELSAFLAGQLDVLDQGQGGSMPPTPQLPAFQANPDFVTVSEAGSLWHGIFYNLDDTTFGTGTVWHKWGCPFQNGNSLCGIEIRQAFAHLLDRPHFVSDGPLQGGGVALADELPPSMVDPSTGNPVASSLASQCSWDTLYLPNSINSGYQSKYGTCLGAFNIAPDPGGFAAPGSPDFCAAVDHLIVATTYAPALGLRRDPAASMDAFGNHCGIDPASPGLANIAAHPMRAYVRNTDPRRTMGQKFARALDQLFAGRNVNVIPIANNIIIQHCVFLLPPFGPGDCWEWYTFGYQDPNPYPTRLYTTFDSQFASNLCGGPQVVQPSNPTFVCIPSLDTHLQVVGTTPDQSSFYSNTYAALNILGSHAVDLPAYAFTGHDTALTAVDGLVNAVGVGYESPWSFLSAHKGHYSPVNPLYQFNGGGPPDTIRRGEAGGDIVANLNPYFAQWPWEFDILGEVYDTLFAANPMLPTQVFCWICDTYTTHVDSNGNEHFVIQLRQNLRWQDDTPLTASDVAFSILTERDFSAVLSGNLPLVQSVTINSPQSLSITWTGASIDAALSLGSALIIPQRIYDSGDNFYGQGIGRPNAQAQDPAWDPIANGAFIGSGAFVCRSVFPEDLGKIGTGCVTNADGTRGGEAIGSGGAVTLSKYDRTGEPGNVDPFNQWFRSNNPNWGTGSGTAAFSGQFQEFSWADRYDNATVTIQDLASVAACFGKTSASGCVDYSYWLVPAFHPGDPNTITSEVTIVAAHLDDTWVSPFSWNGNQGQQPGQQLVNIIPFNS